MTPATTARGLRTRAALVSAARVVFERDGFTESRITDITAQAGVATGSFYTHFESKGEVLAEVLYEAQKNVVQTAIDVDADDPYESLADGHRAYFANYAKHARLMLLMEEVAALDPGFRELRRRRGQALARRTAGLITQLQDRGAADAALDPYATARALDGMVSHLAYYAFVLDDGTTVDELVRTVNQIWRKTLAPRSP